jgi:hypothetical protein
VRLTRPSRPRIRSVTLALAVVVLLPACGLGSTDVAGGTDPAEKAPPDRPTRPGHRRDRPDRPPGPRGDLERYWNTDVPQVKGTFSWVIIG